MAEKSEKKLIQGNKQILPFVSALDISVSVDRRVEVPRVEVNGRISRVLIEEVPVSYVQARKIKIIQRYHIPGCKNTKSHILESLSKLQFCADKRNNSYVNARLKNTSGLNRTYERLAKVCCTLVHYQIYFHTSLGEGRTYQS